MPNWVTNKLFIAAEGERWQEILDFIKGDSPECLIDFNKIIPMPEDLDIENSNIGKCGMDYLDYLNNLDIPECKRDRNIVDQFLGLPKE